MRRWIIIFAAIVVSVLALLAGAGYFALGNVIQRLPRKFETADYEAVRPGQLEELAVMAAPGVHRVVGDVSRGTRQIGIGNGDWPVEVWPPRERVNVPVVPVTTSSCPGPVPVTESKPKVAIMRPLSGAIEPLIDIELQSGSRNHRDVSESQGRGVRNVQDSRIDVGAATIGVGIVQDQGPGSILVQRRLAVWIADDSGDDQLGVGSGVYRHITGFGRNAPKMTLPSHSLSPDKL